MLTELIELGQKMKEIKQNIWRTNSDRRETRTQSNDLEQNEEINIQSEQNEETRIQKNEERLRNHHQAIITWNVKGTYLRKGRST